MSPTPNAIAGPSVEELRRRCAASDWHEHDGCSCSDAELLARAGPTPLNDAVTALRAYAETGAGPAAAECIHVVLAALSARDERIKELEAHQKRTEAAAMAGAFTLERRAEMAEVTLAAQSVLLREAAALCKLVEKGDPLDTFAAAMPLLARINALHPEKETSNGPR